MAISNSLAALEPLRSVHTTTFPALLPELGLSLVVSTYQAGKVVLIRADGEMRNVEYPLSGTPKANGISSESRWSDSDRPKSQI